MDLNFQEIAAIALDEWEQGHSAMPSDTPTEDFGGIKFQKLGGGSKAPSVNPQKPAEAPKGPKKMGASEAAQAQSLAGKSQAEQAQSLADHDEIYHKKKPYDPATSTCTLRQKLVETQKAIGQEITPEQAKQMRISTKDLNAGNQAGRNKVRDVSKGRENSDPMLSEIHDMRKKAQSLKGEERQKADAEIQAKCVEFAKKNLGEAQGEAVEGLFNKIKVAGSDMAQKIKDAFAKRDERQMSEAAKEVKDAIVAKADETLGVEGENPKEQRNGGDDTQQIIELGGEGAHSFQFIAKDKDGNEVRGRLKANDRQGAIRGVVENGMTPTALGQEVPEEGNHERSDTQLTLHENQPAGNPDEQQVQALKEAISEVDSEEYNEEISDYDKDVRRTEIANRAARYLEDWRDLDDPDKRAEAVQKAIEDIEKAKEEGTEIQQTETEAFEVSEGLPNGSPETGTSPETSENPAPMGESTGGTAPAEKRWTEEGLQKRIDEIRNEVRQEGADKAKLFAERAELVKKLHDGDFDAPSREDYQNKAIEADNKVDEAERALEEAKNALNDARTKDEKEAAEQKVAEAEEALTKAKDAAEEAWYDADNYEEPKPENQNGENGNGNGEGGESSYSTQIGDKTYVDVDKIEKEHGFLAALGASFKAGFNGNEIVTGWDKMTGRWDKISAGAKNDQQKKDIDSLAQSMAQAKALRDLKKKAALEKDPSMKEVYEQCVAMAETAKTAADLKKVFDHANKNRETIRKGNNATELNKAKVSKEAANTARIEGKTANEAVAAAGKEESRKNEERRRDEKLQMSKDKEEDRKRHQRMQEDMAKAKFEYQKAKDEGKRLPRNAAEMNPGVVQAIEAAKENCKDAIKKGELEQVLINLRSDASRDPSKALQWQEKANTIINGKAKNGGDGKDLTVEDLPASTKQEYTGVDKNALDAAIGSKLNGRPTTGGLEQQEKASNTSAIDGIMNTLGLGTNVTGVVEGPTYSTYTLARNPHIDEKRIASKIENIQSALGRNDGVRVITQSDGSLALQVPNRNPQQVNFGEIFKSPEWATAKQNMKLPVILGKDGEGKPMIVDLADELHMLVGGATGQGKSVLMNSIVSSLMAARDAGEIDIDMLDPKAMEFTQYEDSPHLTRKPCTEPKEMAARIEDFESRMRKQQAALAEAGRRDGRKYSDVWEYNAAHPEAKMKPAILFIDECADVLNDKRAKAALATVLALGRAPGFHVVMATQRPSKEVMSSKTLANVDSRVAFKTASSGDSETILDTKGAEDLVGKGDMIFKPRKGSVRRGQGAYMTDKENSDLISEIGNAHRGKEKSNTQPEQNG